MGDTLLDPDERRHLLQFVIATLRGLALLRLHEHDPALFDPHLARLRHLIAGAMLVGIIVHSLPGRERSAVAEPHAPPVFV